MQKDANRDLLFGLFALQNGLIDQSALLAAFQVWKDAPSGGLGAILCARHEMTPEGVTLIECLVAEYCRRRGLDATQALGTLQVPIDLVTELNRSADERLAQALPALSTRLRIPRNPLALPISGEEEEDATLSLISRIKEPPPDGARFLPLQPHARGGLGVIYRALDRELNREVALKRIKEEYANDASSKARFVSEAEITGALEHPGIVPVYSLGHDGFGRPYYAMRLIRGKNLANAVASFHCQDSSSRDPGAQRIAFQTLLRRFLDVCNAIAYAHSRGVLHRDIKPSNVMVGKYGETLVVDWGLAKVLGTSQASEIEEPLIKPSSTTGSSETLPGSTLGTPAYMSPEQARGELDRLGPASDVYSLGATLYTILTGVAPVEASNVAETLECVRSGAIPRPSARKPGVNPALEAICLKAMAHEPQNRYPTPKALAEEIEHWLADEPVSAYPEPLRLRLARWGRRHRTAVASLAMLLATSLIALTIGLIVVSRQRDLTESARSEAQRNYEAAQANFIEANTQRQRAENNLAAARGAVDRYFVQVSRARLLNEPGMQPLRRELLESAIDYYRKIAESQSSDARSRMDVAIALSRWAQIARELDGAVPALEQNSKALDLLENVVREQPNELDSRAAFARVLFNQGELLAALGRLADAEAATRRSIDTWRTLLSDHGGSPDDRAHLAASLSGLASLMSRTSRPQQAEAAYAEALEILKRLGADQIANTTFASQFASCLYNYAQHLRDQSRMEEARKTFESAIELRRQLASASPRDLELRRGIVFASGELGGLIQHFIGSPLEARPYYEEAVAEASKLAVENPNVQLYQRDLAVLLNNTATLYAQLQDPIRAKATGESAVAAWRKLAGLNPVIREYQVALGDALAVLSGIYEAEGEQSAAKSARREARGLYDAAARAHPEVLLYAIKRGAIDQEDGVAASAEGLLDEARRALDEAVKSFDEVLTHDENNAVARAMIGRSLGARGDVLSRSADHSAGLADLERALSFSDPVTSELIHLTIAKVYARKGDLGRAEAAFARVDLEGLRKSGQVSPGYLPHALAAIDALFARQLAAEDPDRAEALAQRALSRLREADQEGAFANATALKQRLLEESDLAALRERTEYLDLVDAVQQRLRP